MALCCFHCTLYPVQRVIDGDSFVSGRNQDGSESRVRLYGVDTPETWERDGQHRELLMAVEDDAERDGNRGLC